MGIEVTCPHCDHSYTLAETQEGKRIRCKQCEESFVVRRGRPSRHEQEEDEEDRPRRRSASRDREDEDEDEDDRPRRRRTTGGVVPLWAWLAGGGGLLLILILVVVVVASKGDKGNKRGNPPASVVTTNSGGIQQNNSTRADGVPTLDRFRKLRYEMTEAEVRAIVGPPTQVGGQTGNSSHLIWLQTGPPSVMLEAVFQSGKLRVARLVAVTYTLGRPSGSEVLGVLSDKGMKIGGP